MIINKNNMYGSEFWLNSAEKNFIDIQIESRLPNEWLKFNYLYIDNILKPINQYVINFIPKPELFVEKKHIVLRQKTHAEIWFENKSDGLYSLDKCWQRQFYPSNNNFDVNELCYMAKYKFYMPWIIDENCTVEINNINNSPFFISNKSIKFIKQNINNGINTYWIDFNIYKDNKFIVEKDYGIINLQTPICDFIIKNKKIIDRVINEYN